MAIGGLVIGVDPAMETTAVESIRQVSGLSLGVRRGGRWSAVLETTNAAQWRQAEDTLLAIPGVVDIAVACIHYDEDVA